jgi:aspartyl/asparaginyl beta-hydroxylase (cupin superfamily)
MSELRGLRRKYVKKAGKRLVRWLDEFFGRQSLIGDHPVFDPTDFDFVKTLQAHWRPIRVELDQVLQVREDIPSFHELSPDQQRISTGDHWKMFVLYGFGHWAERNARQCPETVKILKNIPELRNAFFSILSPRFHVVPHQGVTKALLRCQLALKIPQDRENVYIRVADHIMHWDEGKCMVFDDTYDHEVRNDTDETRVILFLDIFRPMRWTGRVVGRVLLRVIQWTAYVKDARKNLMDWEDRFESAVQRAESFQVEANEKQLGLSKDSKTA